MFALLASMAIHLATLAGLAFVDMERFEASESPPLVARLAPLAPPEPEAATAPAKTETAARPKPKSQPRPKPKAAAVASAPLSSDAAAPVAAPADQARTPAAADQTQARAEPPVPEPATVAKPAEAPIAFPERIELEFDVVKSSNDAPMGRVVHLFERDGARYVIRSETSVTGIAKLFTSARYVQESRGTLTPQGLQPDQFVVRRGRNERTESTAFDWSVSRATLSADGNVSESALQAGAQDQLSYLHQLSFLISDPSLPAVTVSNGRRFLRAKLEILGWETVATGLGPTNALHVRSQLGGESQIDYWLAPSYGNLPVKVRFRDKRSDEFDQVLTAVKVTKP